MWNKIAVQDYKEAIRDPHRHAVAASACATDIIVIISLLVSVLLNSWRLEAMAGLSSTVVGLW